jgi:probable phosphoglycerate mutase
MTTVLWARHGHSEANLTRTFSHRVHDPGLTPLGQSEAAALADRLASRSFDLLACSPMCRAVETARAVAERLRIAGPSVLEDLRELNVGLLDGRSDDHAWQLYDQVLAVWAAGDSAARFPGGEDLTELTTRLRRAITTVTRRVPDGTVVIVSHGGNLRAALAGLTGGARPDTDLPNVGVAVLRTALSADGTVAITVSSWLGS